MYVKKMLVCIISPTIFSDYIKREFFKRQNSIHDVKLDKKKYTRGKVCHVHGSTVDIMRSDGLTMFSITHPSEIDPKISELVDYYVIKNNKKTLSEVYCNALSKYINVDMSIITNLKHNQYVLYNNINGEIELETISNHYDQYCRNTLELDDNVHPTEKYRYKNINISSNATNTTFMTLYEYTNISQITMHNNINVTTLYTNTLEFLTIITIEDCKSLRKLPDLPNCTKLICKNCSLMDLPLLPKKMEYLDVSNNKISYITKIPKLDYCNISHNNITLLPKMYCKDLDCSYNLITKLSLSSKVLFLMCHNNRIQELNTRNVVILDCSYNNITTLKGLTKMNRLVCNNNRIKVIPNTKYIKYINCSYNEGIIIGSHKELTRLEAICSNPKINGTKLPQIINIIVE